MSGDLYEWANRVAPLTIVKPFALFDERGRSELAHLLVWGNGNHITLYPRTEIEARIKAALERIAKSLEAK